MLLSQLKKQNTITASVVMKLMILAVASQLAITDCKAFGNDFRNDEDSLRKIMLQITEPEHDFERLAINLEFKTLFSEVLQKEGSMDYPFDSLVVVSRLTSPDGTFRIISWYVPLSESQFEYFGFFQSRDSRSSAARLFMLEDKAMQMEEPMYETLDHENWYGAYYTQIIHRRHQREDYYTLLGWRGDNPLTRKRIIEPLRVMGQGRPSFGQPVFTYRNNRNRRVIFEYSAKVTMSINYESHVIDQSRRSQDIIIFDRMEPTHSFMRGHYQFYVPETNIFDGFYFDDGRWIFIPDIDARNPERPRPPRPVPPSE